MKSIKKFIVLGVLFAFALTLLFSQNDRELIGNNFLYKNIVELIN